MYRVTISESRKLSTSSIARFDRDCLWFFTDFMLCSLIKTE